MEPHTLPLWLPEVSKQDPLNRKLFGGSGRGLEGIPYLTSSKCSQALASHSCCWIAPMILICSGDIVAKRLIKKSPRGPSWLELRTAKTGRHVNAVIISCSHLEVFYTFRIVLECLSSAHFSWLGFKP